MIHFGFMVFHFTRVNNHVCINHEYVCMSRSITSGTHMHSCQKSIDIFRDKNQSLTEPKYQEILTINIEYQFQGGTAKYGQDFYISEREARAIMLKDG